MIDTPSKPLPTSFGTYRLTGSRMSRMRPSPTATPIRADTTDFDSDQLKVRDAAVVPW